MKVRWDQNQQEMWRAQRKTMVGYLRGTSKKTLAADKLYTVGNENPLYPFANVG
jgi:hypothetical protein